MADIQINRRPRTTLLKCDICPSSFQENIVLHQKGQVSIKVIDFGSSCYEHEKGKPHSSLFVWIFLLRFLSLLKQVLHNEVTWVLVWPQLLKLFAWFCTRCFTSLRLNFHLYKMRRLDLKPPDLIFCGLEITQEHWVLKLTRWASKSLMASEKL